MPQRHRWPKCLWLVRHGQSEGNVARDAAHERVAVLQSSAELHEGQLREARTHLERVHALLASRDQAVEAKEQALLTAQGTLEQVRAQLHSATTEARVAAEQQHGLGRGGGFGDLARTQINLEHPAGHWRADGAAANVGVELAQRSDCGGQIGLRHRDGVAGSEQ